MLVNLTRSYLQTQFINYLAELLSITAQVGKSVRYKSTLTQFSAFLEEKKEINNSPCRAR